MKYGVTQNLTADLTVNTDFAQVEVDEQQVNLTRFNLFFPEKRDFFLEGAGTFAFAGRASAGLAAGSGDTPYLFFSRRIGLDGARQVPLRVGGRVTGKVGDITVGALNVQTGEDAVASCRLHQLHRAARQARHPAAQQHRRHVHAPHGHARHAWAPTTGLGLDATLLVLPEPAHRQLRGRRRAARASEGDDLSYRGFFDYNADRYGVQVERLDVQPNFLPEVGFLRRTDMRRNFGLLRFSPRPRRIPHVRRLTALASLNYVTNTSDRLDTREQVGQFQTEFTNSDVVSVTYTDSFERLVRPFAIAPGVRIPVGGYDFHTTQLSLHRRPAATLLRRHRLRGRPVLQRRPPLDRAQHRAHGSDAAVLGSSRACRSTGWT